MLDLVLAVGHHLMVFALFAVLIAELALVRKGLSGPNLKRVAAIDLWYGVFAAAVIVVGVSRAVFAAKGWDYYSHNLFFWAKVLTFGVIGALSVPPTICYIRWRRAEIDPDPRSLHFVRRLLWTQTGLFALLPAFAAAMARGYGHLA